MFDQHFMEERYAQKIAALVSYDDVLEVGPGKGALTKHLHGDVVVVEKDQSLLSHLEQFSVKIVHRDILLYSFKKHSGTLVSNLPYSISEPFFYKLITASFKQILLTTGKNFYEKLHEDCKIGYYRKHFFSIHKHFVVPKTAFDPKPRVESVCFELKPIDSPMQSFLKQYDKKLKNALVSSMACTKREAKEKITIIPEKLLKKKIMHLSNYQFMSIIKDVETLLDV